MNAPLIAVPLALEWLLIVTALTPGTFLGKFTAKPNCGIVLWFISLISGFFSIVVILSVTVWSLLEMFENAVEAKHVALQLISNLAIWAVLALGGVTLALINNRIEPLIERAKEIRPMLSSAAKVVEVFQGVPVKVIRANVPVLFSEVNYGSKCILVTSAALDQLTREELEAGFWHEIGHLRGRHARLRSFAKLIRVITPRILASRCLVTEIDRLTELAADQFALRKVSVDVLAAARAKFLE